mgnify:CR=1 FL=1
MRWWGRWMRRIRYVAFRTEEEREMEEEMRLHIQLETDDLIRRGVEPGEARRRATITFGGVDRHREAVREARGVLWIEQLRQDVGFALRTLRRSPGFGIGAVLLLGIGIGATTTAFGVVDSVVLKPLPYASPDELVRVWPAAPETGQLRRTFSVPDFRDWRDGAETLDHLALYSDLPGAPVLTGHGDPEEVPAAYVTGEFFDVFGTEAALGRTLRPRDDVDGFNRVVVVSHDYWTRRFGADPSVIGTTLTIDQQPYELVGVMPPEFAYPTAEADMWVLLSTIPQGSIPTEVRGVRFLFAVGRLARGATIEQADQELDALASGLADRLPDTNGQLTAATVAPLRDIVVGDARGSLWLAFAAVGLILLITCANVGGLLLARIGARRDEIAVRVSLGAGRGRVVRQLLTESALLGALGGVVGLGVAWLGTSAVVRWGATAIPRGTEIGLDRGGFAAALALTAITTLAFGMVPALRGAGANAGGRALTGGRRAVSAGSVGLRRFLVAAEVALAVVLLVAASLLVRSFGQLQAVDPGFETPRIATMTLTISAERYPERESYMPFYRTIMQRIDAMPAVEAVGSLRQIPFRGAGESIDVRIPGVYEPDPAEARGAQFLHAGGDVFEALGVPVVAGRSFDDREAADAPPRFVVNEAFRRAFSPNDPLVGRTIVVAGDVEVEIIGVVGDVHQRSLETPPDPTLYVHQEQESRIGMGFLARVAPGVDPTEVAGAMRRVVADLDPEQPVSEVASMRAVLGESLTRPRLLTAMITGAGLLAALLAAVGLYGVIATVVRQRRREVGLRMALGADRPRVVRQLVREGMMPAAVGVGVGLGGAALLVRALEPMLFGVTPFDPVAFVAAAGVATLFALVACSVPATRASRLEPAQVLREE